MNLYCNLYCAGEDGRFQNAEALEIGLEFAMASPNVKISAKVPLNLRKINQVIRVWGKQLLTRITCFHGPEKYLKRLREVLDKIEQ